MRSSLKAIAGSSPASWESNLVLRPLWFEFPTEAIRVHALQECSDALLVPIDEHGDAAGGGGVQCAGGDALAAAVCGGPACAVRVSGMAVGG